MVIMAIEEIFFMMIRFFISMLISCCFVSAAELELNEIERIQIRICAELSQARYHHVEFQNLRQLASYNRNACIKEELASFSCFNRVLEQANSALKKEGLDKEDQKIFQLMKKESLDGLFQTSCVLAQLNINIDPEQALNYKEQAKNFLDDLCDFLAEPEILQNIDMKQEAKKKFINQNRTFLDNVQTMFNLKSSAEKSSGNPEAQRKVLTYSLQVQNMTKKPGYAQDWVSSLIVWDRDVRALFFGSRGGGRSFRKSLPSFLKRFDDIKSKIIETNPILLEGDQTKNVISAMKERKPDIWPVISFEIPYLFFLSNQMAEALKYVQVIEEMNQEEDVTSFTTLYLYALIKNANGDPTPLMHFMVKDSKPDKKRIEEKQRQKILSSIQSVQEKKIKKEEEALRRLEQAQKHPQRKLKQAGGGGATGAVRVPDDYYPEQAELERAQAERLRRHERAEEERRKEAERLETIERGDGEEKVRASAVVPPEGSDEAIPQTFDFSLSNQEMESVPVTHVTLKGKPLVVDGKITNGNWHFTRSELIQYLRALGCKITEIRYNGRHEIVSLALERIDYQGQLITFFNNDDRLKDLGSMTLPWVGHDVPEYMKKQILTTRYKIIQMAIAALGAVAPSEETRAVVHNKGLVETNPAVEDNELPQGQAGNGKTKKKKKKKK